ncbi:PAS domain S-box-containing protein [Desulfoprunum benzoelyticum]|uniref:histidine kinase n=4 Tax=Desulfoprunum benzoelyticum TaxID=1506996 RepID=A0A840UMQ0_9BACT|nr:PAS domain S-box-containing protein [Desulfoprunum benzoelyticum]
MAEQRGKKQRKGRNAVDWRKKYERLEENIPGMVFSLILYPDHSSNFSYVSKDALELIGLTPEALTDDAGLFLRLIHPADREGYEQSLHHNSVTFSPWRMELRLVINGLVRWYDFMARPEPDWDGAVCWHGLILDITARKEAEKLQVRTTSLLHGIFTQNPYPIWIADRFGSLIQMNSACRETLKRFETGAAGGYNILRDSRIREQGFLSVVRVVFDGGSAVHFLLQDEERVGRGREGDPSSVFEVTVAPVKDEQGLVTNVIVMYNDITERLRAEANLRLTQYCIDHAGISIFSIEEPDGRVISANHHACRSLGYSLEELTALTVFDIDPNFTRESWLQHRHRMRASRGGTIETMHRRKDGTTFPVKVLITILEFEGKDYSFSLAVDISDR